MRIRRITSPRWPGADGRRGDFTRAGGRRIIRGVMQPHGTVGRYGNGNCRCTQCRRAWADYMRARGRRLGRRSAATAGAARRMRLRPGAVVKDAYYLRKVGRPLTVYLTALGWRLLEAAQARTGRRHDDVVEAALRQVGPGVRFTEDAVTAA